MKLGISSLLRKMRCKFTMKLRTFILRCFTAITVVLCSNTWSQQSLPTPSIETQNLFNLLNQLNTELERESAVAAIRTYQRLITEQGCQERLVADPGAADGSLCTGRTFQIFRNIREIIQTANDIQGSGPSEFSLRSNLEGLGFALRWLAAEEYAVFMVHMAARLATIPT